MNEIELMIDDCMTRQHNLSKWELEFIQSVSEQFDDKGSLSYRQQETLEKIWEKVT